MTLFQDNRYLFHIAKMIINSVTKPLVKTLQSFQCENISKEKADYLVEIVEKKDFSVERVSINS